MKGISSQKASQPGLALMTLAASQDYIIEVVPQGGQVINYTLKVTVQ